MVPWWARDDSNMHQLDTHSPVLVVSVEPEAAGLGTGNSCFRHLIGPDVLTLSEVEAAPFLSFSH